MTEPKTVTAREIKQIAASFEEKPKFIMWHGKRIKVTPLLTFKETFELIGSVMNGCTKHDENVIVPETVDFVFKVKTIERYGNIKLPDDIEDQFKIIYGSDIVECIWKEVNQNQLKLLKKIINSYSGVYLYE